LLRLLRTARGTALAGVALAALCLGSAAHAKTIYGTAAADTIRGTKSADRIYARGGNDAAYGRRGFDRLYGGRGRDRLYGGRGRDRLYGGGGRDRLYGGGGRDRLYGGGGRDRLYGGDGGDRLYARDAHRDWVYCGRGNDRAIVNVFDRVVACEHAGPPGFFTGPAGRNNAVSTGRTFVGLWRDGAGLTEQQARNLLLSREAFLGRKVDIMAEHYGAPTGTCYSIPPFGRGSERWNWNRGVYTLISWSPGYSIAQVNSGMADACFRNVARRFKAFGHVVWLRLWWEFNGDWFLWSYNPNNPRPFITAWRRVVGIFKREGVKNTMFTWCPAEGYYDPSKRPSGYPGDKYVDWVCSDGYNWNSATAWCGTHAGWCQFWEIFQHGSSKASWVEKDFRARKPYIVGEHGSVEDSNLAGRKRQWFLNERDRIKSDFPNLRALLYFDIDRTAADGANWRLDTSQASLAGFRALARDPYFNTRR
jgi:hypothetical protein